MNPKDLAELKRRLNPDKRNPSVICGYYVDHVGSPITAFELNVGTLFEQENERYMSLFRRVLSGQIGQNLIPIGFEPDNPDYETLLRVRAGALNDGEANQRLFARLIAGIQAEHPDTQSVEEAQKADNWLILLMNDTMDVRRRNSNDEIDYENSDGSFNYILCAVCPVKQDKTALRYDAQDGLFRERLAEWIVGNPALGFLFPLYEGGAADVNTILFYSRDQHDAHGRFLEAAFNVQAIMPASEQTDTFQTVLAQSLGTDCSLEVVQEMHETVSGMIAEQNRDDEPLMLSGQDVARMLTESGVPEEKVEAFQNGYDQVFGAGTVLPAVNVVAPKQFRVDLPSISIKVDPEQADQLETRTIDGRSYLLIPIDGDISVNGQPVFPKK